MFLEDKLQSDQKLKKRAGAGPHPTDDMLFDYILGWMDETDSEMMDIHFLLCKTCAEDVSKIRRIDTELDQKLLDWANSPPKKNQLTETAIKLMTLLKNTPKEFQKFVRETGPKKLATLTLLSKEKSESDEERKLLNRLWEAIRPTLGPLSSAAPQTRYAKSAEPVEVDFMEFDGEDVSGAMNVIRKEGKFLLSGYYTLKESHQSGQSCLSRTGGSNVFGSGHNSSFHSSFTCCLRFSDSP